MASKYADKPCPHCGVLLFVRQDTPMTPEAIECDRRGGHWLRPASAYAQEVFPGLTWRAAIQTAEDHYRSLVVDDQDASDAV